jgi:hypothetical protein
MAQLEKLVVSLEARINQYEKSLAKAQRTTDQQFTRIEQRGARLESRLSKLGAGAFGAFAKGATLALAPLLSVGAALGTAKAAMDDFDKIAKQAKASGLDPEFFQELGYAAELGGMSVDELSSAMSGFIKNAGLAAEGKGRMVTALKALNPELLQSIQLTQSQEERLRLVADALDKEGDASRRAAIAAAAFGDSGIRMVEVLKGGSAALEETARNARNLGLIIDRDLLARAEQMNDEFGTATKVIDMQFKQALIELAPILIWTAQLAGGLASGINYISDSMQNLANRGTARLQSDLEKLDNLIAAAGADYAPDVVGNMGVQMDSGKLAELQAERDATYAELKRRAIDQLRADLSRPKPRDIGDPAAETTPAEAASVLEKQAEAVRQLVADLQHEQTQLGRTAEQQELYNALKSAGVTLESAYGQEIQGAMTALQAQRSEIEKNAEAMALFDTASQQALNTVIDGFLEGKDAGEIFRNLIGDIGQQLLSMGVSGLSGGLGNALFPGIPRREHGGPVRRGQAYVVGEKRAELFVPDQNGTIIPQLPDASAAGGSGGGFTYAPVIDARGADVAAVARLERVVAKDKAEFTARVKEIITTRRRKW